MILKNSALHRKGAKIAKVRKEKQFVGRNKRTAMRRMRRVASGALPFGYCALRSFHRRPQGEWLLSPLRSLRLRAFAVRFSE